jgi:hypothetical protein
LSFFFFFYGLSSTFDLDASGAFCFGLSAFLGSLPWVSGFIFFASLTGFSGGG